MKFKRSAYLGSAGGKFWMNLKRNIFTLIEDVQPEVAYSTDLAQRTCLIVRPYLGGTSPWPRCGNVRECSLSASDKRNISCSPNIFPVPYSEFPE